jgi:vacuolar-type H+-ATPase subunit I/STV1
MTTSLSPLGKVETREVVLAVDRLTTEDIVRNVKDYARLKEEIAQILRQIGIERDSGPAAPELSDLRPAFSETERIVRDARSEYQEILSQTETIERQIQEVEKQISAVEQLNLTGFSYDEMLSRATGFRRVLGRLPSKKVEGAQKALRALLKDSTVMTTGTKRDDRVYLLVATPTEAASQTLQTLLLYDFIPTDMPVFEGPDLTEALKSWQTKRDDLKKQKDSLNERLESLRKSQAGPLNRSADQVQEILLLLRSSLRLGEGTTAAHILARLEKPLPTVTVNALQKDGMLELD